MVSPKSHAFGPILMSMLLLYKLLALAILVTRKSTAQSSTLDGYAFDCGGMLLGFQGIDQVVCLDNKSEVTCGTYQYTEAKQVLTGRTSLTGSFLAFSMQIHDGILVSFQSDLGKACHTVTLDWRTYSSQEYMGLSCPVQNEVQNLAYETNHFSFGVSGDVALRSPIMFSSGRRLVRDSYGIYTYNSNDESIRIYFGPQQGKPVTVLQGHLTLHGQLYILDFTPQGPCIHDGQSLIRNVTQLPSSSDPPPFFPTMTKHSSKKGSASATSSDRIPEAPVYYSVRWMEQTIHWILLVASVLGVAILLCA